MVKFEDFGLDRRLIRAVSEMHYNEPTLIQEKCIPAILRGVDVVAQSSTGSGKTAAFGLPVLQRVERGKGLQFVILTPTRELCLQVKDALVLFSKYMGIGVCAVYGGAPMERQIQSLRSDEVMVGTPGRVLDHLKRGTIRFGAVKWLVLDEADRMLDMGFIEDVSKITSTMPKERQTMLFSATIPYEIRNVINKHLRNPEYIKTESYVDKSHLRQIYYSMRQEEKFSFLVHLLKTKSRGFALVFCGTRRHVDSVTRNLITQGVEAISIHGGMPQNKRLKALEKLKNSSTHVMVATDVAARGLDIRNITHIYNYDVPKTSDEYIHRIGRTARAGAEGDAITFVSPSDHDNFRMVLSDKSLEIKHEEVTEHERLPFTARLGGGPDRRGRPENLSRTGKEKSGFSNTFPREHSKSDHKKGDFSSSREKFRHPKEKTEPKSSHLDVGHHQYEPGKRAEEKPKVEASKQHEDKPRPAAPAKQSFVMREGSPHTGKLNRRERRSRYKLGRHGF